MRLAVFTDLSILFLYSFSRMLAKPRWFSIRRFYERDSLTVVTAVLRRILYTGYRTKRCSEVSKSEIPRTPSHLIRSA